MYDKNYYNIVISHQLIKIKKKKKKTIGFHGGSDAEESACNAGYLSNII